MIYKLVGAELGISTETVRTHIKRIYETLHIYSVTEAGRRIGRSGVGRLVGQPDFNLPPDKPESLKNR